MKEKDLKVTLLYDFYAPLFSEKKREVFEMYYFDDLSLAEISEHTGKTRQGARELIARAGDELREFEESLGLFEKEQKRLEDSKRILEIAEKIEKLFPEEASALRDISGQKGE